MRKRPRKKPTVLNSWESKSGSILAKRVAHILRLLEGIWEGILEGDHPDEDVDTADHGHEGDVVLILEAEVDHIQDLIHVSGSL